MTEQTCDIARLDYSGPPPGYVVEDRDPRATEPDATRFLWEVEDSISADDMGYAADRDAALNAAWVHYKRHNDPPGMRVVTCGHGFGFGLIVETVTPIVQVSMFGKEGEARDDAWAWHDRRHALATHVLALGSITPDLEHRVWAELLTWPTDHVEAAEADLANISVSAEMPEVLRG